MFKSCCLRRNEPRDDPLPGIYDPFAVVCDFTREGGRKPNAPGAGVLHATRKNSCQDMLFSGVRMLASVEEEPEADRFPRILRIIDLLSGGAVRINSRAELETNI